MKREPKVWTWAPTLRRVARLDSEQPIAAGNLADILSILEPGDGAQITIEGGQPYNRILYQRINQAAYRLWGSGKYQMRSEGNVVTVGRPPMLEAS